MHQRYILCLDLGSSGLRSLLAPVAQPWALIPGVARPYRVFRSAGTDSLDRHFSPVELEGRVAAVLRDGLRASGVSATDVAAISITAQRQAVAFLAGDGSTIYVGPNTDLRAVFEGAALDERLTDPIHASTGHLPSFLFTPAKLHWWRRHHPRLFRRIHRVLTLGAWAAYQLTGEQADVPSQMNEAGLAGLVGRLPSALLAGLEVDPSLLPSLVDEGTAIGGIRSNVAQAIGLPTGTPVVMAGPDSQAALLGMGVATPGEAGVVSGWSTPVQVVTGQPVFDAQRRTWTGHHLPIGLWVAESNAGDTGGTLDMVRRMLGSRAKGNRLDRLAIQSRAGANLVTAFWGPHAMDMANTGVAMGGLLTPVPITYNAVHAGHLARATLENIAYAVHECLERLASVTGRSAGRISLSGGLAQSTVFPQLLSDVLGVPIRLHHHRASAIGAAIAASVPRDQWPEAASRAADQAPVLTPDVRSTLEYSELYRRWLRLKAKLNELSSEL